MVWKVILAAFCFILVIEKGYSRGISMYDLQPAKIAEKHSVINGSVLDADGIKLHRSMQNKVGAIYRDCSKAGDKFKLTNVLVAGCTANPCILKKGTEAQVEIDFVANVETQSVKASVYGEIAGVDVPFPINNTDACTCGVTCPTVVGKAYKYKYSLPVSTAYPSVEIPVLWYFNVADKSEGLCMSVLVKIES